MKAVSGEVAKQIAHHITDNEFAAVLAKAGAETLSQEILPLLKKIKAEDVLIFTYLGMATPVALTVELVERFIPKGGEPLEPIPWGSLEKWGL